MALLQFVGKGKKCPLKLREDMIDAFPWYDTVNRVIKHELDPFIVETPLETVHDIKKNLKQHKYEDLMNQRATELLALNKPIYVMWSGGIDSTAVLVALLKNATPQQIESIHVVCSMDSVNEYPEFWGDITKIFKGRIKSAHFHPAEFCKQGIVVTGELADQCFGSDVLYKVSALYGYDAVHKPWQDVMPKLYNEVYGPNKIIEKYEQTLSASVFPIKTAFDWMWWFNFTNKWNHVSYAMLGMDGWGDPATLFNNVHRFHGTVEFQQWSMQNQDLKIKKYDITSYKYIAKEYVVSYTKHESYLKKRKEPSLGRLWKLKKPQYGITPQLEYLTLEQIEEYVNR